ncbi:MULTISPECIES: hypothetical protein [unclassified Corynebacterium]|uniref:hypothetical protein n=1 Tax=unclassified Corynebacterium TaxID=2624378 RepID=UPI002650A8C2|nr:MULTISPECIES: hypothetical protein [unclassified Corynebacterium]MDN8593856.1 hypothetical protein [Corynebacterium sp. P4_F2]WKK55961.1 hypothetical protein QYR03_01680 [Corynebacterium sp. P4-C1]
MTIRKGILAAATAATVSVSGVVAAPAFAADTTNGAATTQGANNESNTGIENNDDNADNGKNNEDELSFGEKLKANSSDKDGNWDPKAITNWIGTITAVLGLVGTVIAFA